MIFFTSNDPGKRTFVLPALNTTTNKFSCNIYILVRTPNQILCNFPVLSIFLEDGIDVIKNRHPQKKPGCFNGIGWFHRLFYR